MKKKKSKMKKIIIAVVIVLLNSISFMNTVYATPNISSAYVYSVGNCGHLLKYQGIVLETDYVQYTYEGASYPAYCLDATKIGAQKDPYTVSVQDSIKDVELWKRIINGYPYKSIEELGVANKEEAFAATKQAVYCYIHGRRVEDYEAIGEAGERTLRALRKIVEDANNSHETKISSTIQIHKLDQEWKQDTISPDYVYKTFSVSAGANIKNYKITLEKENANSVGGIKVTNLSNIEKSEFAPYEKFKVLVPIRNMAETGTFQLTVESQVETKPILYGASPNSVNQDYALTAATYEDGKGTKSDEYPENETELILLKEDEQTGEKLEGVEFEVLDENKNVVYSDLKTNQEGKIVIQHLIPGKYYIREIRAREGYEAYEQLIEISLSLHEQYTVKVKNRKEDKPEVEIEKRQKNKEVKTLPITGM